METSDYTLIVGSFLALKSDVSAQITSLQYLEQLKPNSEYLRLFNTIVLDVWERKQVDARELMAAAQRKLDHLNQRKQRVIDAFLHEGLLDTKTYEGQRGKLSEEITLAEIELHETRPDEIDVAAVLNFAQR